MPKHLTASDKLWHLCAVGLFALCLQLINLPTAQAQTAEPGSTTVFPLTDSVTASINQARANAGLGPLAVHPLLVQAAQLHADDMVTNRHYSHVGTDGSSINDRVRRSGYSTEGWSSENWVSVREPGQAITWWMNSPIHRNNILNPHWAEIGVGAAQNSANGQTIFVAVFARNGTPSTTNAATARTVQLDTSPAPSRPTSPPVTYTVRPGDTLSSVAASFGLSWQEVAVRNGLTEHSLLQIGQVIRLTGQSIAPAPAAVGAASQVLQEHMQAYTVQPGDTLFSIAGRTHIDWQILARLNNLSEASLLQVGQRLYLPESVPADPTTTTASGAPDSTSTIPTTDLYTVQPGETIIHIATRNALDWQQLLRLNGLTETAVLQVGQKIRLR